MRYFSGCQVILAVGIFLFASSVQATEVGSRVLSDIQVEQHQEEVDLRILFNFPVRYVSHQVAEGGRLLRVQLQPVIALDSEDSLSMQVRESLAWDATTAVPLTEVVFDGETVGFPEVLIRLKTAVKASIHSGSDFRSLIVSIPLSRRVAAKPKKSVPPKPAESPPIQRRHYVLNLESSQKKFLLDRLARPAALKGYALYTTLFTKDGEAWHRLRLGFFPSFSAAKKMAEKIRNEYPQAWIERAPTKEVSSHLREMSAPLVASQTKPSVKAVSTKPKAARRRLSETRLSQMFGDAKEAMTAKNYREAIRLLTRILREPGEPGERYRRESRELLGLGRERNGQLAHAKAEYKKYLLEYPEGEATERVRQRLAGLLTARKAPKKSLAKSRRRGRSAAPVWRVFGGLSQFYRRDILLTDAAGETVTQSRLPTNLNLSVRRRGKDYDLRFQFTGGHELDFLNSKQSDTSISELFFDAFHKGGDRASLRAGRQSRSSGGVLGRFDGAFVGYGFTPKLKLNAVFGYPVNDTDDTTITTNKHFTGLSADLGTFNERWDFNAFIIDQQVDGITDRRAVGGEMRYFSAGRSLFSLVDYDVSFRTLNTFLVLGTWTLPDRTSFNATFDRRKSPILTTSNALQQLNAAGASILSVSQALGTFSNSELRQFARDRAATTTSLTLGASRPLNEKFQITGDANISHTSGTDLSLNSKLFNGAIEGTSSSGYDFFISTQLIGSGLFKQGDIGILGLRYSDVNTSDTVSLNLNTRYPFTRAFRINPKATLSYRQNKRDIGERFTIKPSLRIENRWKKRVRFEAEVGGEWAKDRRVGSAEITRSYFVNAGYRMTF